MSTPRCTARVWRAGSWGTSSCANTASRDGFCGTHHPETVARRKAASEARYAAARARLERQYTRSELRGRIIKAALADDLDTVRELAAQLRAAEELET